MSIIHLIDDDPSLLNNWSMILNRLNYHVVTYQSSQEFIDNYKPLNEPECALIDLWLPVLDGDKLFYLIKQRWKHLPCILWSGDFDFSTGIDLIRNGAFHVIEKNESPKKVKEIIDEAIDFSEQLISKRDQLKDLTKKIRRLTNSEFEVFECIMKKMSVKQTAEYRQRSIHTITEQRRSILTKLDVPSSSDLLNMCENLGYIL